MAETVAVAWAVVAKEAAVLVVAATEVAALVEAEVMAAAVMAEETAAVEKAVAVRATSGARRREPLGCEGFGPRQAAQASKSCRSRRCSGTRTGRRQPER